MRHREPKISFCVLNSQSPPMIQETQLYDKVTKIQETIRLRLLQIKKLRNLNYLCEHTNKIQKVREKQNLQTQKNHNNDSSQYLTLQQPEDALRYDQEINYYDKFWKLFLMNQNTAWKVDQLYDNLEQINRAASQIEKLFIQREQLIKLSQTLGSEKICLKRSRHKGFQSTQSEKVDKILCPYKDCEKSYCSQISLNLHIKLKHNGGNKCQRELFAEKLWLKRENEEGFQGIKIKLAPGYFEQYGMATGRMSRQEYEKMRDDNEWIGGQVDVRVGKKLGRRIQSDLDHEELIEKGSLQQYEQQQNRSQQ